MRGRTFTLRQKELQRVHLITSGMKGDMACAQSRRTALAQGPIFEIYFARSRFSVRASSA